MTSPYRGTSLGRELRTLRRDRFPATYGSTVVVCFAVGVGMMGMTYTDPFLSRPATEAVFLFGAIFAIAALLVGSSVVLVGRARPRFVFYERGFEVARRDMTHTVLWRDVTDIQLHGVSAGTPPAGGAFTYVLHTPDVDPILFSSLDFEDVDATFGEWLAERTGLTLS